MEPYQTEQTFFTILTLLANTVVVVAALLAIAALVSRRARADAGRVVDAIGPSSRLLAWLVAAVATAGSLYFSEIAPYVPCRLCWFQRICMYPLAAILLVGVLLKDHRARWYAAPFVMVGIPLSTYHFLMEQGVFSESDSCSATVPCAVPWFTELGYVTLAFMALSGFLLIGTLLVVDGIWERRTAAAEDAEDALSPDEATGGPTGNHGGPPDDHVGADDEPGATPALEVTT
jgi:disulfide bond formation protein DsbB